MKLRITTATALRILLLLCLPLLLAGCDSTAVVEAYHAVALAILNGCMTVLAAVFLIGLIGYIMMGGGR